MRASYRHKSQFGALKRVSLQTQKLVQIFRYQAGRKSEVPLSI